MEDAIRADNPGDQDSPVSTTKSIITPVVVGTRNVEVDVVANLSEAPLVPEVPDVPDEPLVPDVPDLPVAPSLIVTTWVYSS